MLQTTCDRMLKLLEKVALIIIFTAVNLKIAYETRLATNLKKRPPAEF